MFRAHLSAAVVFGLTLSSLACRQAADRAPTATTDDDGAMAGLGGADPSSSASSGGASEGGSGGATSDSPGNEASVITWNLERYPLTDTAEEKAVALLGELAPDVVALQEIDDPAAFDALVAALPDYDGMLNDDPGGYIRVGLMWRTDRVTVTDAETLFTSDWYAFPRPPLRAHVHIDAPTPIDFVTVVLHLKAQLDGESETRRRTACERLDAWVTDELSTSDEQDYMLIGDFNDKVTDPAHWNVFGAFLDQPDRYRFLSEPAALAGGHTYIPFESFIDHVVVTSDMLGEVGDGVTEVLPLETEMVDYRDLTDHRPVRTWLSW